MSALAAVSGRTSGFGPEQLMFDGNALVHGEVWRLISYAFIKSDPLGLMLRALVLFIFGRLCEGAWGSRDFLRFYVLSSVGGAAMAVPLWALINSMPLPFHDLGLAEGPDAAIDAMMVAL